MLWLTSYDQLFAYPASQLTLAPGGIPVWLPSWKHALWSLGLNLATTLSVQAEVFLLPLIGLGLWHLRKDRRVQLAALAWLLTFGAMTVVFPFAGARGGFLPFRCSPANSLVGAGSDRSGSGNAVGQTETRLECGPGWNHFPDGVDRTGSNIDGGNCLEPGDWRDMPVLRIPQSQGQAWNQENYAYSIMDKFLVLHGAAAGDTVMVADPPGFYLESGNPTIAIPDGDINTLLAAAQQYHAFYLILEAGSVPAGLLNVYENPNGQMDLTYLGEVEHARIFLIHNQ